MKKKILVIGGSGYLGTALVKQLILYKKFKIYVYDKKKFNIKNKNLSSIIGTTSDYTKIKKVIKNSDIVYNFAGISDLNDGSKKPIETIKENILNNAKIIEYCIKYEIERFIYSSSIYVYSEKGSFYRCSKQAAENYIKEYCINSKLKFTILRFGSLYGPGSKNNNGVHKIITDLINLNKLTYYGSSRTLREYIYIDDAAKACVDIMKKKYENKYINITGKRKIYVKTVLDTVGKILGKKNKVIFQNKKNPYHYEKSPFTFKRNFGLKYPLKKQTEMKTGLNALIKYVKMNNY